MKNRLIATLALGFIVALVVAACGGADPTATPAPTATAQATATPVPTPTAAPTAVPPTATPAGVKPKYGGVFANRTSGFWQDWDSRSIGLGSATTAYTIAPVLNGLIVTPPYDPKNLEGDLAESWSVSVNGLGITLNLRRGVQWQDGVQFTSKDVVFTLDKFMNPGENPRMGYHKGRLSAISAFEAADDYTVNVKLSAPVAGFIARMATPSTLVYPAHIPHTDKIWNHDNPVGTGPFAFDSSRQDALIKFARNPNYWKKDAFGQQMPYLDGVELHAIRDRALGQAGFKTGRLHMLGLSGSDLLASEVPRLKQELPDVKTWTMNASQPVSLQFYNRPPWDNLNVRRAIHAWLDREEINDVAQGGAGYSPTSLMVPQGAGGQWALPDDEVKTILGFRQPKDEDRALAQKLLEDAGIDPSTLRPTLLVLNLSPYVDAMTVFAAQLTQLGLKPEIAARDSSTARAEVRAGNFDIYLSLTSFTLDDPVEGIFERVLTDGGQNNGKWSFPEIDALATEQATEQDPARRRAILQDLQRQVYDLAYEVPFFYFARGIALQSYVEGWTIERTFNQSSSFRHDTTWFDQ